MPWAATKNPPTPEDPRYVTFAITADGTTIGVPFFDKKRAIAAARQAWHKKNARQVFVRDMLNDAVVWGLPESNGPKTRRPKRNAPPKDPNGFDVFIYSTDGRTRHLKSGMRRVQAINYAKDLLMTPNLEPLERVSVMFTDRDGKTRTAFSKLYKGYPRKNPRKNPYRTFSVWIETGRRWFRRSHGLTRSQAVRYAKDVLQTPNIEHLQRVEVRFEDEDNEVHTILSHKYHKDGVIRYEENRPHRVRCSIVKGVKGKRSDPDRFFLVAKQGRVSRILAGPFLTKQAAYVGFKQRRFHKNPRQIRMGKLVEIRYQRDHGKNPGFYKHTFTSDVDVYSDSNRIVARARH